MRYEKFSIISNLPGIETDDGRLPIPLRTVTEVIGLFEPGVSDEEFGSNFNSTTTKATLHLRNVNVNINDEIVARGLIWQVLGMNQPYASGRVQVIVEEKS